MGWLGRLFDRRDTWARLFLLDLTGVSYLLFTPDGHYVTSVTQWVLAVLAFVSLPLLGRHPIANLAVQGGLLAVAFLLIDDTTINQVGSSWALGELVVWAARPRVFVVGAALLASAHIALDIVPDGERIKDGIFSLVIPIGLPLLLGLVVRTSRELSRQSEQQAAMANRAARADERAAIARELHDVVAHHVASMVLRVGVVRHVVPGIDPRVGEVLDDVHSTGSAALTDLRRLVAVLRDEGAGDDAAVTVIEPGTLPTALGAAVDTARRAGLTVEADVDEAVGTIDSVRGLAVLRLTQEALTNVAKHAGPSAHARLRVAVEGGDVIWEVSDDGGADPVVKPPGGGHGLTGMRERVEVLGGELSAGPQPPGWRVATVLPGVAA
ncbi:two-component sensor histidine kinase [Actinoplanes sp. LDG1-06]|uniref:histidine kinase n=1 Tax=Paractinoplanes ovalisporus TaxID=2810368 RepID=A0ABS2AQH7_9ACTN|nr:histidine kinase [Actinoplanes ovalisporus]MBM2622117.1 two-component sensor histidine kinase [Actinoplanes ovalisporus]